jgi:hypothetical protein
MLATALLLTLTSAIRCGKKNAQPNVCAGNVDMVRILHPKITNSPAKNDDLALLAPPGF